MKGIDELNFPEGILYANDHEWAETRDGHVRIGISDYAQDQLGDVARTHAVGYAAAAAARIGRQAPQRPGNARKQHEQHHHQRQCLRDDGLIYLEAPRVWSDDELAQLGLQLHRQGKAGVVAYHLLRPLPPQ